MIWERTCSQCVLAIIVSAASNRNFKLLNQHVQSWRAGVQQGLIGRSVCQPLVGVNSTPSLGWGEERNFIQCKQLNCDIAQLWSSTAVRRPWSEAALGPAPLWCGSSTVFWLNMSVFQPQLRRGGLFDISGKGEYASRAKGELTYRDRSPHSRSLIGLT